MASSARDLPDQSISQYYFSYFQRILSSMSLLVMVTQLRQRRAFPFSNLQTEQLSSPYESKEELAITVDLLEANGFTKPFSDISFYIQYIINCSFQKSIASADQPMYLFHFNIATESGTSQPLRSYLFSLPVSNDFVTPLGIKKDFDLKLSKVKLLSPSFSYIIISDIPNSLNRLFEFRMLRVMSLTLSNFCEELNLDLQGFCCSHCSFLPACDMNWLKDQEILLIVVYKGAKIHRISDFQYYRHNQSSYIKQFSLFSWNDWPQQISSIYDSSNTCKDDFSDYVLQNFTIGSINQTQLFEESRQQINNASIRGNYPLHLLTSIAASVKDFIYLRQSPFL